MNHCGEPSHDDIVFKDIFRPMTFHPPLDENIPGSRGYACDTRCYRSVRAAFTLIELLAVISIIAILAALSFVGFGEVRQKADAATCANNMRLTAQGVLAYAADNNGYFPPVNDSSEAPYPKPNSWVNIVPMYYLGQQATSESAKKEVTRRIMRCPTNRKTIVGGTAGLGSEAAITNINQLRTFAMNFWLGPKTTADANGNAIKVVNKWRTVASINRPARTIMLSESGLAFSSSSVSCQPEMDTGTIKMVYDAKGNKIPGVHSGCNNIAWCDGHVSPWKDVSLLVDTPAYREGGSDDHWSGY